MLKIMIPEENDLALPLIMIKPTLHRMPAVGDMRVGRL